MNKLRVGVLMGGKSIEREVSFNSGRTICDHLDTSRYDIVPLFQQQSGALFVLPTRFLHRGKTSDFEHRLATEAQPVTWDDLKHFIDFCYIALHGRYAEDGTVQGLLEILKIPYLGAKVFASALGMDKIIQKKFLLMHGIETPRDITVYPNAIQPDNMPQLLDALRQANLSFPLIIKPHKEGSSLGMSHITTPEELYPALEKACAVHPGTRQAVLVEEKISGMEFTCVVLTDYATGTPIFLPPTEVVFEPGTYFYDYEQKYMPGRATKYTPARCTPDQIKNIQETCLCVMRILEFENIARIDGFLTPDGRVVIIDPNSLTGMAPASFLFRQAAEVGMSHRDLINHLIKTELHHYGIL